MPSKLRLVALLALFGAIVLGGCRSATVHESVLPRLAGNDEQVQMEFWHELATRPMISNDEAFHGILLYLDRKDDAATYEQRVAALKARGMLVRGFNQPADQALQRGTLAVAVAKTLNIKGGLTMRVFGPSGHYATRELEYRGIFPRSSAHQIFTGAEFVGVIGKTEDWRQGDPTNLPASVVSEEAVAAAPALDDPITPLLMMIAPEPPALSLSPATTTAATTQAGPMKAIITAVDGMAWVRPDESAAWQPAKVGMELNEKAEFRTGPRGTIQFAIPPDQTVTVDRLTVLQVLRLFQDRGKVTTDLGIKYGRTRYDLEGGGLEHQSTLRSPNATLAVRGTKVSLSDQPPYGPIAVSLTGRAVFNAFRRQSIAFGNRGQGKTVVSDESNNAATLALTDSVVDPRLQGARTESEAALLTNLLSRSGSVTIDRQSGLRIVRGGTPPTESELVSALPGRLNFVMRWDSDVNLDLGVSTPGTDGNPGGEFIYPAAGLNIAPGGGKTAFDHRGGSKGGIEVVYFNNVVDGSYALGGPIITQGKTATATLTAYLDGKNIPLFDGLQQVNSITQTVSSGQPALGLVFVNTPPPIVAQAKRSTRPMPPMALVGPKPFK